MNYHLPHRPKTSIAVKVLLWIAIAVGSGSCSSTKKINREVDRTFSESEAFRQGFAGFALLDPATEKMLYEYNSDHYFTPASNTKLFTFYTGIKILPDSIPALKFAVRNDSLFFTGTGDPSFLNRDLPVSGVYEFLRTSREELVLVLPHLQDKHYGPGWAWDDYNSAYSAEKSPFPIYGNKVSFNFDRRAFPEVSPSLFSDSVSRSKTTAFHGIQRDPVKNRFFHNPSAEPRTAPQEVPFRQSPELTALLLSDTLHRKVSLLRNSRDHPELTNSLYSIPADSLYKRLLQQSDNLVAEQILLLAAGELSDTLKSDIAIKYMKENHLQDLQDDPVWRDGSGLSRYNLITPRSMVQLLRKIRTEIPQERLFSLMAAGGESGTLKNSYRATAPFVYAKTGTLSNNHSLSGYLITRKGQVLIFSFMNSNYTVPTSYLKQEMEQILRSIRDNY